MASPEQTKDTENASPLPGARAEVLQARAAKDTTRLAHALAVLGEIHLQGDQPEEALSHLQESADLFQRLGSTSGERHVSGLIGLSLAALDQPAQAESFLEIGRAFAHEIGDREAEAHFFHTLAVISLKLHQTEKATSYAKRSLRLCTQLKDMLYERATVLQVIGMILQVQERPWEAIDSFRQSLSLLEREESFQSHQVRAATQQYLASAFHQVGQDTESARWSTHAYRLFTALGEQEAAYRVLQDRARFDLEGDHLARAARFAKQATDLARGMEDANKLVSALTILAEIQKKQGHPKLAIASWQECAESALVLGDKRRAADLFDRVGQEREGMNHTYWASFAHRSALRLYNDLDDLQSATRQLAIIASLQARQGYFDVSQRTYRSARRGYRTLGDSKAVAATFIEQGIAMRTYVRPFQESGLGYLRFGIDLLAPGTLAEGEQEECERLIQRGRQLLDELDHELGEVAFHRLLQQSEAEYAEAAIEADVELQKHEREAEPLDREIDRLGLARHAAGREEEQARAAVELIEHYGYCEAAIYAYEEAISKARAGHNRLGEAILTGTIALLRQALRPGSWWGSWVKLALLYRDAGDALGLGRTLYNEAVRSLHSARPNLEEARCYLQTASSYLAQAQAGESAIERARALMVEVEARMSTGEPSQKAKKRSIAPVWLQEQLLALGAVKIFRGPVRREEMSSTVPREQVAEAGSLLEATRLILSLLLEEGLKKPPQRLEYTAYDGDSTGVSGVSFGVSLLCEGQQASDFAEGPYLAQFLAFGFADTHDVESLGFQPIAHPTREGFKPGISPTTRKGLEQSLLAYLDREYQTSFGSRAVQVLNAERVPVCRISWGYSEGFLLSETTLKRIARKSK